MKRTLALLLCLCLVLSACGGKENTAAKTPEELAEAYTQAINGARDEEMNGYFPVETQLTDSDPTTQELLFSMLGFVPEDVEAYGLSMSLMNVNAYAIVAAKPAEGKEETVKTALEGYVENQRSSFERYLEDQYEIAASAKLEVLKDGTVLLVMCEDQDTVFDSIRSALEG